MAKKLNYAALFTLRKDGRYMATYTDKDGRHYLYDRDPKALYDKLQAVTDPRKKIVTFGKVADSWERVHREEITDRTWNNYRPHYEQILALHGDKPVEEVTALDIINHLTTAKAKGLSATVVNSIRSVYRMIFDFAIAQDLARYNPATSVRLPKGLKRGKRKAPEDDQIRTIFEHADAPFGMFPLLLICTGMRKSEALALQWKDIDWKNRLISVTKSVDYTVGASPKLKAPKTEAGYRTVPIIDVLFERLKEAHSKRTSDYIFPAEESNRGGKGGGIMTLRGYEGAWLRWCQAAGLMDGDKPAVTAHHLRHGTATLMFEMEVDELTAQRILGHSRIEVTREIYTDLRQAQKMKSMEKFNAGMGRFLASPEQKR